MVLPRIDVLMSELRRLQSTVNLYRMILSKVCSLDWPVLEYVVVLKNVERRRLLDRQRQLLGWLDDIKGLRMRLYGEIDVMW